MTKNDCQINVKDEGSYVHTVYMDDDIAILDNINEFPHEQNTFKVEHFSFIACLEGKMSINVNAQEYIIHTDEILVCVPGVVLDDCMMSPDFRGRILGVSRKFLLETLHMGNEIWDKAFRIKENPVIHLGKQGVELLYSYNSLINQRIKAQGRTYGKEVLSILVCAFFYEVLSELSESDTPPSDGTVRQKDLLFKKFIVLLSSQEVKQHSVGWYADKMCISPKYLSSVSKEVSGRNALSWIHECVMMDIRHQLKYSDRSIKEVADRLGFANISFFGKFVRAHVNMSPTDYRKLLREKREEA